MIMSQYIQHVIHKFDQTFFYMKLSLKANKIRFICLDNSFPIFSEFLSCKIKPSFSGFEKISPPFTVENYYIATREITVQTPQSNAKLVSW